MARKKKEIVSDINENNIKQDEISAIQVKKNKINIELNQEDKKENEYINENNKNQPIENKIKNKISLDEIINKNEILEPIDYLDELPELKDLKVFNKSIMQNCFLFRLKREEPKRNILIQTNNNETFLGQLISFDEYTLHVYVNDGKFNSAMLFFKSGLTYIRVLSDAAYQYYLDQQNKKPQKSQANNKKPYINNISKNSIQNRDKVTNTKIQNNTKQNNKLASHTSINKLANKFNSNLNKKRKDF